MKTSSSNHRGLMALAIAALVLAGCAQVSVGSYPVSFAAPVDIAAGQVEGVSSLDAADIDQDGLMDVAVLSGGKHAKSTHFSWFEAPATGHNSWLRHDFNAAAPLKSFLGAARLADLDGDGDVDLVVSSDHHSGKVRQCDILVFDNPLPHGDVRGPWSYRFALQGMSCHHINDMETADMDQDGRTDIIVRSLEPNEIHILFQDGAGAWSTKSMPSRLERSEGLAVGDLNGDGRPDISYTGHVLLAPEAPRDQAYSHIVVDGAYAGVNQNTKEALGDIDGDGRVDLLLAPAEKFRDGKPHDLVWYKNPGGDLTGVWQRHVVLAMTNNMHTAKLAYVNDDRHLDIVTGIAWDDRSTQVFYNLGRGKFSEPQTVSAVNGLYSGVVVDVDADGDVDIIGQETYARDSKPYLYRSLWKD